MIKIEDSIFNENEIKYIMKFSEKKLQIMFKNGFDIYVEATFDDIEWNYGNTDTKPYVVMTRSIAEDLANANKKIEELEEENKELVETNYNLATKKTKLEEELNELKKDYSVVVTECKKIKGEENDN